MILDQAGGGFFVSREGCEILGRWDVVGLFTEFEVELVGVAEFDPGVTQHKVERFVMISTDKAVRPTSVMGATKRMAELIVQNMAATSATSFSCVRFGNVLASRGSVVGIFRDQIKRGGPVTVTHPEATRYFMTIPEAANLVIQAATLGHEGDVFLLDMGEPVRILDLARLMIHLSGASEERVPIKIVGTRPGEKLYEELRTDAERIEKTELRKIFRCRPAPIDIERLEVALEKMQFMVKAADRAGLRGCLRELGIDYNPRAPTAPAHPHGPMSPEQTA